jgi:hypothetical protein
MRAVLDDLFEHCGPLLRGYLSGQHREGIDAVRPVSGGAGF